MDHRLPQNLADTMKLLDAETKLFVFWCF